MTSAPPQGFVGPQPVAPFIPNKLRDSTTAQDVLQRYPPREPLSPRVRDTPVMPAADYESICETMRKAGAVPKLRKSVEDYLPPISPRPADAPGDGDGGDAAPALQIGEEVAGAIASYFSKREKFGTPAEFFGERFLPRADEQVRRYFAEDPDDRLRHAYGAAEPPDQRVHVEDLEDLSNPSPRPPLAAAALPSATAFRAFMRDLRFGSGTPEEEGMIAAPPPRRPIQQRSATADKRTLRRNRTMRTRTTRLLLSHPTAANPANGIAGMGKDWHMASSMNPNRGGDRMLGVVPPNNIVAGREHRRRKVTLYSQGPVAPVLEDTSNDIADLGAVRQKLGKRASKHSMPHMSAVNTLRGSAVSSQQ